MKQSREEYLKTLNPEQERMRKGLLGRIHGHFVYKTYYAADDDMKQTVWRPFLKRNFGVESSADLTIPQLIVCLDILSGRRKGDRHRKQGTRTSGSKVIGMISEAQNRKISVLANLIDWEYADGLKRWCQKRFHFDYPKTDFQAIKVIDGLKGMFDNQMKKKHGENWMDQQYDDFNIMRYIGLHKSEGAKHAKKRSKAA